MTNFASTRQLTPASAAAPAICSESLAQAFTTFSHAADSLETTYLALHAEVQRLREELDGTNHRLGISLAENLRTRLRLENILRCLPCGVVVTDHQGRLSHMNPAARRLLSRLPDGPSEREAPARGLAVPAEFAGAGPAEAEIRFAGATSGHTTLTYGICRSELSVDAAESSASTSKEFAENSESAEFPPLPPPSPGPSGGWVYILRDLTHEKTLIAEREAARRLTTLAEVSAVLAHEIRNPLASLELFAGLLARSAAPGSPQAEWTRHIQAGLRTLGGTVNNVLQLYSDPAPETLPLDLTVLLADTCEFLRPLAEQWQVRITPALPPARCLIRGVAHQLQQVVLNIALNAFRVSPTGSELRIELDRTGERRSPAAVITITDEGPGIPPELAGRIFEPGFSTRADSPGIGLAVSRRIIGQHGGTLTATNTHSRGASFVITLPCVSTAVLTESDKFPFHMSHSDSFELTDSAR